MEETNISVAGCNLFYSGVQALFDVTMDIDEKRITAFIGPSGCGKSTFIRVFNRMNDLIEGCALTGSIKIGETDIYARSTDVTMLRRDVGMVFQKPNPFPMSIYDNIAFAPRTVGITKRVVLDEIVERSLQKAGLWAETKDRLRKSALGLSGGQQQRLCIARTLAAGPKVILMDEPTSALDPISTGTIEDLLRELRENYTIVIVTHNMQQAGRISDKTAFFLMGKMIEYDKTAKIFHNPTDERTDNYIRGRFG